MPNFKGDWAEQGWVLCKHCQKRHTKDPSGLCSRCSRSSRMPAKVCSICGKIKTRDPSGVCSYCRSSRRWLKVGGQSDENERLEQAIIIAATDLRLLKLKKQGASYSEIGAELDMSSSAAHLRYMRLIGRVIPANDEASNEEAAETGPVEVASGQAVEIGKPIQAESAPKKKKRASSGK